MLYVINYVVLFQAFIEIIFFFYLLCARIRELSNKCGYFFKFIASQLQIHPRCLLCENRSGPFQHFSLPAGTKTLSIEGAGETLQGERVLLPGSGVQARQIATAQVTIHCTQQPGASSRTLLT